MMRAQWLLTSMIIFAVQTSQAQVRNLFFNQNACDAYQGLIKSYGFTIDWRFQETSGTSATDALGGNSGTYYNAPTLGVDGPLLKPSNAILFNGSNQFMSSNSSVANPTNFTVLAWFRTTTTNGGKIIGFGDSQSSSSSSYDRHIYMNNAGNLYFGVYNGSVVTLSTTAAYNDGNWHMAVASVNSTTGMTFIVDGATALTNANTSAQSYTGYWKVGFDNIGSWPSAPSSPYFYGTIGEVAISSTNSLTASQMGNLYNQGSRCTNYSAAPATLYLSGAQSTLNGLCSSAVTVTTNTPPVTPLTVNLSGSGLTFYSDASCSTPITSTSIAASSATSSNFYFVGSTNGSLTLTAAASSYASASQTETVSNNSFRWTGAGANANWSTAANWSGGAAPGTSDVAYFNNTCSSNCSPTISASIDVGGVRLDSTYSGTLTQSPGSTITIESADWVQNSGNFVGSNSGDAITINGGLNIASGTFTASRGNTTVRAPRTNNYTVLALGSGATYNHNNGTFVFFADMNDYTTVPYTVSIGNTPTFYNITFDGTVAHSGYAQYAITSPITVSHNLNYTGYTISHQLLSGTINLLGNLSSNGNAGGGTGTIVVKGNTTQTYASTSNGAFPTLTINTTGSFSAAGGTTDAQATAFILQAGTFNAPTSTFSLVPWTSTVMTVTGGTYNANGSTLILSCNPGDYRSANMTVSLSSPLTIAGLTLSGYAPNTGLGVYTFTQALTVTNLTYDGSLNLQSTIDSGTVKVSGAITATTGIQSAHGGAGTLNLIGSSTQAINVTSGYLPDNITINHSGGSVNLNAALSSANSTVGITAGSIHMGGYNMNVQGLSLNGSTIYRDSGSPVLTVNGSTISNGSALGGTVSN